MKKLTKLTALTLTAALTVGLTACGSTADTTAAESTPDAAGTETTETAGGDLLSEIQAKGTITVAMEGTWAPWT